MSCLLDLLESLGIAIITIALVQNVCHTILNKLDCIKKNQIALSNQLDRIEEKMTKQHQLECEEE